MFRIETAHESHIPEIVGIWKDFFDYHAELDPFYQRAENGHIKFEGFLWEAILSPDSQVLVALYGREVVGYAIAGIDKYRPFFKMKEHGFISDLAVKPEYRRNGIGELLFIDIKKWFSSHCIKRIELRVVVGNDSARTFWERHGFKQYVRQMYLEI
jgi:ribosomal protein S18 acetylase RimI-like enzyme